VLGFETDLDGIAEAYAAMDERRAIKSLVRVGAVRRARSKPVSPRQAISPSAQPVSIVS
jgi:hypothetical protein